MPVCNLLRTQETRDFDLVTLGPPSKILEDELRLEVKLSHEQLYHLPLIVLSSSSSSIKQNFLHFCSFAIRDGLSFVFAYFCFPSTIFFSQETNFAFPDSRCLKLENFPSRWRRARHKYFCGKWGGPLANKSDDIIEIIPQLICWGRGTSPNPN